MAHSNGPDYPEESSTSRAESLLRRIGWHTSDLVQIEVYARIPPSRKVAQMLRWRDEQVRLLKARLKREHPDCSEAELFRLLQEHLDLVREPHAGG